MQAILQPAADSLNAADFLPLPGTGQDMKNGNRNTIPHPSDFVM